MKEAVLFAGQGVTGQEIIEYHNKLKVLDADEIKHSLPLVQEALNNEYGSSEFNLQRLLKEDPLEKDLVQFSKTSLLQPITYFLATSAYKIKFLKQGVKPDYLAGHSLGEYSALFASSVKSLDDPLFEEILKMVIKRGKFMQEDCEENSTCHLGMKGGSLQEIENVFNGRGTHIALINGKKPSYIVIGCQTKDRLDVEKLAKDIGVARIDFLSTAGAFHTPHMQKAAKKLAKYLEEVTLPYLHLPIITNLNGMVINSNILLSGAYPKEYLVKSMTNPVQWVKTIETLVSEGVDKFTIIGVGNALFSLNRFNGIS